MTQPQGTPEQLPERRVGAALRAARKAAGLSLREMARRLNFESHSTLSEYENGARMPSEEVVQGYERLLHLGKGSLLALLEAANIERHGDAWAKRRIHVPLPFEPGGSSVTEYPRPPLTGPVPATLRAMSRTPASPFPDEAVQDGSDPDAAGCSVDAVTIHARRVALKLNRVILGHIELRYCQRAGAAWGRFEGYASLNHLAERTDDVKISIEIEREGDGTRLVTTEPYCFDLMWGNLLTSDGGSFIARTVISVDKDVVASGETDWRVLG
jgi:transcriptional regulator with XRE-family HTH domain